MQVTAHNASQSLQGRTTALAQPAKKILALPAIRENSSDWDILEERIKELFKKTIYYPLLREVGLANRNVLKNSIDDLYDNLRSGRITFFRGRFSGKFSGSTSKELKRLGATWDRKSGTFVINQKDLPREVQEVISMSAAKFEQKLVAIDKRLAQMVPEEIAGALKSKDLFNRALFKTEKSFKKNVEKISVAPNLTPERAAVISDEWATNMKLWIKDFTEKEILELRQKVQKSVMAGNRYGSLIDTIQKSYGVSANKAKFLARQETQLLLTTFKETRYKEAGSLGYKWKCVAGTKLHPVRPSHKKLDGKVFRWDDPPVTTEPGEPVRRNNPGQDYNCRCYAQPLFKIG